MGSHPLRADEELMASVIDVKKADWILCNGCICNNQYWIGTEMSPWCLDRSLCLCLETSFSGVPKQDVDPKMCVICLPGLLVFPKVGCCMKTKDVLEGEELAKVPE